MRRIGVLLNSAADDPAAQSRLTAFLQGLQELGWTHGRNVRIAIRWGADDAERVRKSAAELVALAPDVVLTAGSPTTGPLLQATRTVPIVFVHVADPVGAGFVDSLARPGGNATGFTLFEYGISGKWLSPCGCARSWYRARPLLHRARAGFEQQIGSIAGFVSVQPISLLLISGLHRIALIDRG